MKFSKSGQYAQSIHLYRWLPALFGILDDEYMEELIAEKVNWIELMSGELLFEQGEMGDKMFILISGRLQEIEYDKQKNVIATSDVQRGALSGELAVIASQPYLTSCVAVRDSLVACLSRETYFEIAAKFPDHTAYLMGSVLKKTSRSREAKPKREHWNIAFVPLNPSGVVTDFLDSIKKELAAYGRVLPLSSVLIDDYLGYERIAQATKENWDLYHKLVMWIDRYESQYNFILYQADETLSEWTDRCLRQADEIVFIGLADHARQLSALEQQIMDKYSTPLPTKQTLVLLHAPATIVPTGTPAILKLRPHIQQHLHIRLQHPPDSARLMRHLSGRSVGLVLSGGAARGLAHVGILKALKEFNIHYDIIGGTSFGALTAGFTALDWSVEQMIDCCHESFQKSPFELNWLPYVAFSGGKRIDAMLQKNYGTSDMSDTWLSTYCIATNTSQASMQVFQSSLMWKAIRASISLPGLLPPVLYEGDFLIDGGIFDNLPIETMIKQYNPAKIIACEVGYSEKAKYDYSRLPSNISIFKDMFRSQKNKKYQIPTSFGLILESIMLCSDYKVSQFVDHIDLFMRPNLKKYGATDMKKYAELIDEGYQYALKVLVEQPKIIEQLTSK